METFQAERIGTELKRLVGEYGWGWSVVRRIINKQYKKQQPDMPQ